MDKIVKILEEIELPFAYDHFAEGESPEPPFICYLTPKSEYFSADGESFDMSKYKNEFTVRVLPATLKFVVPAGVALKEQCREGE